MQNERPDNLLQPGHSDGNPDIGAAQGAQVAEVQISATDRILRLFTSPGSAFRGLHRASDKPAVIGLSLAAAILLMTISTLMVIETTPVREQQKVQREKMEELISNNRSMSSEDRRDAIAMARQFNGTPSPLMVLIMTLLFVPFLSLILGAVALILAKILERGEETRVGFLSSLTVSTLSMVVFAGVSLVLGAIQLLTDLDIMSFGLPLLVSSDDLVLSSIARVVTISSLAFLFYLSLGTARLARKERILVPFAVYLILAIGVFAFFGFLSTLSISV